VSAGVGRRANLHLFVTSPRDKSKTGAVPVPLDLARRPLDPSIWRIHGPIVRTGVARKRHGHGQRREATGYFVLRPDREVTGRRERVELEQLPGRASPDLDGMAWGRRVAEQGGRASTACGLSRRRSTTIARAGQCVAVATLLRINRDQVSEEGKHISSSS
jgi:hypothetical protein